jgi:hypothetical protein
MAYASNPVEDYSPASAPPVDQAPRKPAPIVPQKPSIRAQAMFDFNAAESNELGFRQGDIVTILKQTGDWWEGEMNGRRGLLPSNYVKIIN